MLLFPKGHMGGAWNNQNKMLFRNMGALERNVLSLQANERTHCILKKYSYIR